nr:hypothetical protein [Tanacetum cinerariifolium]
MVVSYYHICKGRPNGKMIVDSIKNEPYVRQISSMNGKSSQNIASNLKFLNSLQLEWKRHVTIVRQTKNLHEADFTHIYDFLKMNQDEVNELRAERLAKSHDPLALMAHSQNSFNFPTTHKDQSSSSQDRQIQNVGGNGGNQFGQYAGQVAQNQQGYNAWQNGGVQGAQNASQNAGLRVLELGIKPGIQLQAEEFDFMAAACDLDEIEEVNANCILMANLQQASTSGTQHDKVVVYDTDGSAEVQLNDNYYDNEIFNMFTQEEQYTDLLEPIPEPQLVPHNDNHVTSVAPNMVHSGGTVETSSAPNEETRAHQETVYLNLVDQVSWVNIVNRNMRATNAELKSELSKYKIQEQHVEIKETLKIAQKSREKMRFLKKEIKPANYAKINRLSVVFVPQTTKSKEELFLSNVSNMVTVSKMISIPNEDLSDDTTPSVARKFLNEVKSSFVTLQRMVKQKMTLEIHNWSSSAHKEVYKIISHEISPIINQVDARVQNFEIQFLQEAAKFVRDFKSLAKEADESLDKQKSLELEIKRILKASVSRDIMSIVQNGFVDAPSDLRTELDRTKEKLELCIIKKEKEYAVLWNTWYTKCEECKYDKISYDKAYNDKQQKVKRLQAQLRDLKELEFQVVNYERKISHLKTNYKNLFDSIKSNRAHAKLHDLIYENAQLRVWGFEKTSESMKNTSGTSVTPRVDKPKLSVVTPLSKKLHASMPSHSVLQPREFNVVKHRNVIAPRMFKINPSQTPRPLELMMSKRSRKNTKCVHAADEELTATKHKLMMLVYCC